MNCFCCPLFEPQQRGSVGLFARCMPKDSARILFFGSPNVLKESDRPHERIRPIFDFGTKPAERTPDAGLCCGRLRPAAPFGIEKRRTARALPPDGPTPTASTAPSDTPEARKHPARTKRRRRASAAEPSLNRLLLRTTFITFVPLMFLFLLILAALLPAVLDLRRYSRLARRGCRPSALHTGLWLSLIHI